MAITESVGYEGTVGYDTYSQTVTQAGRYTVEGAGAWKVSAVTGDRTVRVAAGVGKGYGISDTATDTDLQHDIALSGVRYDLVVAHRDWSTGETEFQIINGGSTATLPSRTTGPGVADDQPLALVRITSGSTVPVVVADLRCWAGDGGLTAVDVLALDYLGEIPGTRVTIGDTTYTRVLSAAGAASWNTSRAVQPQRGIVAFVPNGLESGATSNNASGNPVVFSPPFASIPDVQVTLRNAPAGSQFLVPRAVNVTTAGCQIYIYNTRSSRSDWTSPVQVGWRAEA